MATYRFSALSDGQAISFDPENDVFRFPMSIAAAEVRVSVEGSNLRVSAGGKDVVLLDVSQFELATTNVKFADGSRLLFGDNSTGTGGDNAANTLTGTAGGDHLAGFGGNDTLNGGAGADYIRGGAGNDFLLGSEGGDTLTGSDGNDILYGDPVNVIGNDRLIGGAGNDVIVGRLGNDTIDAGTGDDMVAFDVSSMGGSRQTQGSDVVDGGEGFDLAGFSSEAISSTYAVTIDLAAGTYSIADPAGTVSGTALHFERVQGSWDGDRITGNGAANFLDGQAGDDLLAGAGGPDTLEGSSGNDTLRGGGGKDDFVFDVPPGAGSADLVIGWTTGVDELLIQSFIYPAIGAEGQFAAGDDRFYAAAGTASGHDADDRVIYDTSSGALYYDADGSGSGGAELIATLQGQPTLLPTDIRVI